MPMANSTMPNSAAPPNCASAGSTATATATWTSPRCRPATGRACVHKPRCRQPALRWPRRVARFAIAQKTTAKPSLRCCRNLPPGQVARLRRHVQAQRHRAVFLVHADAVAAFRLGAIHGAVGVHEQLFETVAAQLRAGAAEAGGDRRNAAVDRRRIDRGEVLAALLRDAFGRMQVAAAGEDGEFLATQAAEQVALAARGVACRGHLAQHPVAGGMAMAVVDALEVVEVE